LFIKKKNPQKPQAKVKKTIEEMYVALENRRKIETKSPQSASHEEEQSWGRWSLRIRS